MSDWTEFLIEIKRKREELKCSHSGCWYRGAAQISHGLLPKLIWRTRKPDTEDNLYRGYLRTRMANQNVNSWITLSDMQHFGTATRLLDWTECLGVALFFALNFGGESKKPVIWLLNPFSLACRARASNNKSIGDFHIDPEMDYYRRFIKEKNWPYKYAMPFYAPRPNERIHAQRGFFTVHGTSDDSIHNYAKRHVRAVSIPTDSLSDFELFLEMAGIDHTSMFPDHEGWLRKVEKEYFYAR
ncbi:FRG domain-containing protein [Massilia sp. BJB1822]|uniref:FRG domain-containing protein n=1 Tax=Massilia sp. BJB1822 TaxID=2744470 RepID=UPI001594D5B5|nr:FRG domain-containing protein [Massilia sp. BJB1822]